MTLAPRLYSAVLTDHFERHRQIALVSGPRQVGKTTVCRAIGDAYLNWDNADDRRAILKGPAALAVALEVDRLRAKPPVAVFDELHKHSKWKTLLKGLFDTYGDRLRFIVTGSSRLDVFRRGGDSLMGRYLLYRMHPWSVGEIARTGLPEREVRDPIDVPSAAWDALWEHGGFPEPFLRRDLRFTRRWRSLRQEQLSREDLRDVAHVQDLGMMEILIAILAERSGQQLVYANLAREIGVAVDTAKRWVDLLVAPSLRVPRPAVVRERRQGAAQGAEVVPARLERAGGRGGRAETFVACHLLKAVEGWTDLGFGDFELRYLRDKAKARGRLPRRPRPQALVPGRGQAERRGARRRRSLTSRRRRGAPHAFQVVIGLPFEPVDCFAARRPVVVPARTFLSQLL